MLYVKVGPHKYRSTDGCVIIGEEMCVFAVEMGLDVLWVEGALRLCLFLGNLERAHNAR